MRKLIVAAMLLAGCGNTSVGNELVGQVKKVHHNTPLVCPDYYTVDVSMGVMRNGTGSMSTQDIELVAEGKELIEFLTKANTSGRIVKVDYSVRRAVVCWPEERIDSAVFAE